MKTSQSLVCAIAATAMGMSAYAERIDAVNMLSNAWQDRTWSGARMWRDYKPAGGGGIATFTRDGSLADRGDTENYFNQNVEGLTLSGLNFGRFCPLRLYGKDITFCGPCPWISTSRTESDKYARTTIRMKGDGSNSLQKKGVGRLTRDTAPSDFASLDIIDGTLVVTNDVGVDTLCANGVAANIRGGTLSFEPKTAGGATQLAKVNTGAGIGSLSVSNGGTLTVGSLTKTTGGILKVATSSEAKFLVQDKDSVTAPDGGLVSVSGREVSFLDYDATEGWKAGTSIPANAKVFGTTGDAANSTIETGDISFTTSEGYVWRPAPDVSTTLKVTGTMTVPPNGITFASVPSANGTRPTVNFSAQSKLDGKLRFCGVSVSAAGLDSKKFAQTADISICGSASSAPAWGGSLAFNVQTVKNNNTFDFTLRLSSLGDRRALDVTGADWQFAKCRLNGLTVLEDDAQVGCSDGKAVLQFGGPVTGRGGLWVNGGYTELYNSGNSFAGELKIADSTSVSVLQDGTLGSGDVNLTASGSRVNFQNLTKPMVVTNWFTGTSGKFLVQRSRVALTHKATVSETFVQGGSALTLGGDFRTGHVYLDVDSTIAPTNADVTFRTDNTATSVLAGSLHDGANGEKLSLVKGGANLLVLCGTNNTYSGATVVEGGTLKLGGTLFNASDVSWWIDPSDASTVTTSDGKVTKIVSKVGSLSFTGSATDTKFVAPTYVTSSDSFNGKNVLRFAAVGSENSFTVCPRLTGSASAEHRTVFVVCRTSSPTHVQGALIGHNGNDISLRVGTTGWIDTTNVPRQDFWPTANYARANGQRSTGGISTVKLQGANVFGVFVPTHYVGGGGYAHASNFKPYLGDNGGRPWSGDMGEVIAFNRILTDAECCAVENYLMKKWNPVTAAAKLHPEEACILPGTACLPTGTALTVAYGATLDLNGADQTVASLAGDGEIVNTSDCPARLTVTGSDDFHGRVTGNVTLVLPTGAREIVLREGASLVVSGAGAADATIAPANPKPPVHDLAFWLDASLPDTVVTNGDGRVTYWHCRPDVTCEVEGFGNAAEGVADYPARLPTYAVAGWNEGKPSVFFNNSYCRLRSKSGITDTDIWSGKQTTVMTLFFLVKPVAGTGYLYAFGPEVDMGIHLNPWNGGFGIDARGPSFMNGWCDLLRFNGTDYTLRTEGSFTISTPHICYVMRAEGGHANNSHLKNQNWIVGSYNGDRAVAQHVAEVIAYTKQLTDAEILATEKYLLDKWVDSGTSWPAPETVAYDGTCGLGAANGASLDLGSGDVTLTRLYGGGGTVKTGGALTVSDGFTFAVNSQGRIEKLTVDGNLTIGSQAVATFLNGDGLDKKARVQPTLEVTGTVSGGDLSATEGLPRRWSWLRDGNVWTACLKGFMIFFR